MELRPGFWQDQMGGIPDDWEVVRLAQIGKWFSGGTPSMGNPAYWNGDIPWVSPKDMKVSRLHDAIDHVNEKAIGNGTRLLPHGALLMVVRGMILAHSFPVARAERALAFNQDVKAVVTRDDIDSNFVLHWLLSHEQQLRSLATESTHGTKRIPTESLFRAQCAVPPLPEQRAIAGALGDVDALLNALTQLVAKKRDLKQAAMQRLLTGQTRLPGFSGSWEDIVLERGISLISGHHVLARHCNSRGDGVPYLTGPADFTNGTIRHTRFTTRPTTVCSPNDILVTVKGSGSGSLVVADAAYCISRQLMAIRVRGWDSTFIYYSLLQNAAHIKAASTGLIPGLSRSDILGQVLPLPTVPEQRAIVFILSAMDAEIAALEQRLAKTRALKQGMMQELLTGRIRLV